MQNMGPYVLDDLLDAVGGFTHQLDLCESRNTFKQPARRQRAIEMPAVHLFFVSRHQPLFRAGKMERFPAQRSLLLEDRQCAESVAAVQRNRMIENMQDAHGACLKNQKRYSDRKSTRLNS